MSAFLQGYMLKLVIGGTFCLIALFLCGQGAQREAVRLACACLMSILVLAPLKQIDLNQLSFTSPLAQSVLEDAAGRSVEAQQALISQKIAEYIEAEAKALGKTYSVRVTGSVDEQNVYRIKTVHLSTLEAADEALAFGRRIADDLGIEHGQVLIKREGS